MSIDLITEIVSKHGNKVTYKVISKAIRPQDSLKFESTEKDKDTVLDTAFLTYQQVLLVNLNKFKENPNICVDILYPFTVNFSIKE